MVCIHDQFSYVCVSVCGFFNRHKWKIYAGFGCLEMWILGTLVLLESTYLAVGNIYGIL